MTASVQATIANFNPLVHTQESAADGLVRPPPFKTANGHHGDGGLALGGTLKEGGSGGAPLSAQEAALAMTAFSPEQVIPLHILHSARPGVQDWKAAPATPSRQNGLPLFTSLPPPPPRTKL